MKASSSSLAFLSALLLAAACSKKDDGLAYCTESGCHQGDSGGTLGSAGADDGSGGKKSSGGSNGSGGDTSSTSGGATSGGAASGGASSGGAASGGAATGGASGEHTTYTTVGSDGIFDPKKVYMVGTFTEGKCETVFADPNEPNKPAIGVSCEQHYVINPVTQRIEFLHTPNPATLVQILQFAPDPFGAGPASPYPTNPTTNDPVIAASCKQDLLEAFQLDPETGDLMQRCCVGSACQYLWADQSQYPLDAKTYRLRHLGYGKHAFVRGPNVTDYAIADKDGNMSPVVFPEAFDPSAIRARADGFRLLQMKYAYPLPDVLKLWHVDFEGNMTLVGTYPAVPETFVLDGVAAIDASDVLFIGASDEDERTVDLIVRSELGGASEVIYTEATNPLVLVHAGGFVTGP